MRSSHKSLRARERSVITSVASLRCSECAGEVLDLGDELVCRACGVVRDKEVVETSGGKPLLAIDFTGQALGGYLGPPDTGFEERFSRGLAGSQSSYKYLKLVSDYAGREDSTVYGCAKLIERVAEKLELPRVVMAQAVIIAKALLGPKGSRGEVSTAAISAYSIVAASRIVGLGGVNVREVLEAHRLLGRRVKSSSLIQVSLNSPYKTSPRRAEDYVTRIVGRLQLLPGPAGGLSAVGLEPNSYFAELRYESMRVLASINEMDRGGHSPCSLAATAVYAAECRLARLGPRRKVLTQREIAESGGVAEYTVRELFGKLFRQQPAETTLRPIQTFAQ
jgi:transcription initiation factor TFIIIB Brf1 subunit/transcription initiation factor TFIIB